MGIVKNIFFDGKCGKHRYYRRFRESAAFFLYEWEMRSHQFFNECYQKYDFSLINGEFYFF